MLVIFKKEIVNNEPELIHLFFQFLDLLQLRLAIASISLNLLTELLLIIVSLIHDEDGSIVRLAYALYLLYCLILVI